MDFIKKTLARVVIGSDCFCIELEVCVDMLTDNCNDYLNLCDEPTALTLDEWFANCMNLRR